MTRQKFIERALARAQAERVLSNNDASEALMQIVAKASTPILHGETARHGPIVVANATHIVRQ
ncbi:MAG: hypothetical protein AB3N23_10850 [Paracoccaceae bacterium]